MSYLEKGSEGMMAMRLSRLLARLVATGLLGACTTMAPPATSTGSPPAVSPVAIPGDITIQGQRLFPESITADNAGNIYVGSNPGTVFRARRGSATAQPWIVPDAINGLQAVFGVLADDRRGLLWLCSNPNTLVQPPQTGVATIKAFRLADAALVASYPFPTDAGPAICNDMTIAANGDLYAGDNAPAAASSGCPRVHAPSSCGPPRPNWSGWTGSASGRGGVLYANNIQRNQLLRVAVRADGEFDKVEILPTSSPLKGPDGLRMLAGDRMLQSEGNGGTITVLTFPKDPARRRLRCRSSRRGSTTPPRSPPGTAAPGFPKASSRS